MKLFPLVVYLALADGHVSAFVLTVPEPYIKAIAKWSEDIAEHAAKMPPPFKTAAFRREAEASPPLKTAPFKREAEASFSSS